MCRLVNNNTNDMRLTLPLILDSNLSPNFRQVWEYPHKSGQNIKFVPFFTGNISFHVLDISKLKKGWWGK